MSSTVLAKKAKVTTGAVTGRTLRKITGGASSGYVILTEDGATKSVAVCPTRYGFLIGCTFVTYEALDEINRTVNEGLQLHQPGRQQEPVK